MFYGNVTESRRGSDKKDTNFRKMQTIWLILADEWDNSTVNLSKTREDVIG